VAIPRKLRALAPLWVLGVLLIHQVAPLVWLGEGATSSAPESIKAEIAKLRYVVLAAHVRYRTRAFRDPRRR
jgi:hypothetical protein